MSVLFVCRYMLNLGCKQSKLVVNKNTRGKTPELIDLTFQATGRSRKKFNIFVNEFENKHRGFLCRVRGDLHHLQRPLTWLVERAKERVTQQRSQP